MSTDSKFEAFAFLDVTHPVVAWGTYRGVLVSSRAEDHTHGLPVSMMFAGVVLHQNNVRLQNELLTEKVRAEKFPTSTSRLTGMFFFTDPQCALHAESWGGHFKRSNLAHLEVYPSRPATVVDSNWITYAPLDANGRIAGDSSSWIESYWSGMPFNTEPVWETIVDGRAVVWGTELRERAYDLLQQVFPDALDTLEVARIAALLGSDLGQSTAWLTQPSADYFELRYYMDFRDAENSEFLARLKKYDGPRNVRDLAPGKATFGLPDFRPYGSKFTVTEFESSQKSLYRVHLALGK
ncbi:hypothetical protein [Comamonas testosteroni]|uniref:hypothetical protein n=1 Tax=Comamonas testosteroni TaxID=285 RepID=UPI0006B95441|nr:hypothetical protein [Comamonas testosteroni]